MYKLWSELVDTCNKLLAKQTTVSYGVVGASYCGGGGGNLELTRKTRKGLEIEPLYYSSIQCVMEITIQ